MAVFTAKQFTDSRPAIDPNHAGNVVCQYAEVAVTNALALNDILRMCKLPANCVPVDVALQADTLDSDGHLRMRVALEDQTQAADSEDIITSSELTAAVIGTTVTKMTLFPAAILQDATALKTERHVVVKVTTAGTGKQAGTVRVWLTYRHADFGK